MDFDCNNAWESFCLDNCKTDNKINLFKDSDKNNNNNDKNNNIPKCTDLYISTTTIDESPT